MLPRRNLAGRCLLYERDTYENRNLLKPERRNDHGYATGHPAIPNGMRLCAILVMPNRLTVLGLDCIGEVSEYMRCSHSTVTATRNRRDSRVDSVWSSGAPRITELLGWDQVVRQIVELACTPVRQGRCTNPHDYLGFFGPNDWGQSITYMRPDVFGGRSQMPESIEVNLQPMHAPHGRLLELIEEVNAAIDAALPAALAVAAARRRARRTTPRKGRAARQPSRADQLARRAAKPEFIGHNAEQRQRELDEWRHRYRELRDAFREDPTTVFEAGTVRFRMIGARTAPMPRYRPPPFLHCRTTA